MDRLEAMNVFVAVADLRGFAPAARRLGLSPSAVTRLVAALEEHLGVRLLQRTTRSVALTDAGARYLESARRILGELTEAEGAVRLEHTVPTGRLVVTAPTVFGRLHVVPLMGALLEKYPALTAELSLSDRIVNLVEEGVDLAVRLGDLEDSSYVARPVGLVRRVVVASPEYLARSGRPQSPTDVERHTVIHFSAMHPTPEWRFVVAGALVRVQLTPRYVTNSADAVLAHAERGGGLAMVLSYQAAEGLAAGRLELVLEDFEPVPFPIQVVFPTTRLLSAKVRAFIDLCAMAGAWDFTFRVPSARSVGGLRAEGVTRGTRLGHRSGLEGPSPRRDLFVGEACVVDRAQLERAGHESGRRHDENERRDERTVATGQLHHQHDGGDGTLRRGSDDRRRA